MTLNFVTFFIVTQLYLHVYELIDVVFLYQYLFDTTFRRTYPHSSICRFDSSIAILIYGMNNNYKQVRMTHTM